MVTWGNGRNPGSVSWYAEGAGEPVPLSALPPQRRALWAPTSAALQEELPRAIRPGDAVMVKGSNGSKMGAVVVAIRAFAAKQKPESASC